VTVQDAFPVPRIDLLLNALGRSCYFTTLDMASAYWQIPIEPETAKKLAFTTLKGLYEWTVMPFGPTSAPATLQRALNYAFTHLLFLALVIYFDELVIYSATLEQHLIDIQTVFDVLCTHSISLKKSKCTFCATSISVLGFLVSSEGIRTDHEKTRPIDEYPVPVCVKDVQSFLGMCGIYRMFISCFAIIASSLFHIHSDLSSLQFTFKNGGELSGRLARWVIILS